MKQTHTRRDKGRAVFLAALMVLSVFAMSVSFAGAAAAQPEADLGGEVVWAGETVEVTDLDANSDVQLRQVTDSGSVLVEELSTNAEGEVTIDTEDREAGTYFLRGAGADGVEFEVAEQTLDASFENNAVATDGSSSLNIDSNRATYDVEVTSEDLSGNELGEMFDATNNDNVAVEGDAVVIIDAEGSHNVDFSSVAAGEYDVTVTVTDTGVEDTATITVQEEEAPFARFNESTYSEEAGDIVEFTVEMENVDSAQVELTEENDNYNPTLEVTDGNGDGEVTVSFNTHLAGEDNANAFSAVNSEDNVVFVNDPADFDQTGDDSRLLPAAFDLQLFLGEGEDREEVDVAALFLTKGSIDSATSGTAPSDADLSDVESISDATTASDEIAEGDNVVVAFDASGVFGAIEEGEFDDYFTLVLDRTADAYDGEELEQGVDYELYEDPENDRFFVVLNSDEIDMEAGDEFELILEPATDDSGAISSLYFIDDEEYKKGSGVIVSTEFSIVERMIEVTGDFNKEDQLLVPNDEEATVTGESNAAPGTDVRVQLRATGEDPFLMSQTVEVQEDGSVEATFDLSEHQAGQEFTVTMTDQTDREVQNQVTAILTGSADGDRHTVVVHVEDANGNAVSDVEIHVGDQTATTDDKGKATLELAHGEYDVTASHDGVEASGTLTVDDETPDEVTLTLGEENVDLNDDEKDDKQNDDKKDDKQNDNKDNDDKQNDDKDDQPGSGPDEDQPGFGIVVALVALLAAAGFALRRQ